jgi:hypothetical protein
MMIDTFDPAAVRPPAPIQAKITEPEQARPVQGATESLDSGLDVNKERNTKDKKVEERKRDSDPHASTYDSNGNQKESPGSPSQPESDTVDLFV